MRHDLNARYEVGPASAATGGSRHDGRRRADGCAVCVHRLTALTASTRRELRLRLVRLPEVDARLVLDVFEVDGTPVVVTLPLPDGLSLLDWLAGRPPAPVPSPASTRPSSERAAAGESLTTILQAPPAALPVRSPPASSAAAAPPRVEAKTGAPPAATGEFTRLFRPVAPHGAGSPDLTAVPVPFSSAVPPRPATPAPQGADARVAPDDAPLFPLHPAPSARQQGVHPSPSAAPPSDRDVASDWPAPSPAPPPSVNRLSDGAAAAPVPSTLPLRSAPPDHQPAAGPSEFTRILLGQPAAPSAKPPTSLTPPAPLAGADSTARSSLLPFAALLGIALLAIVGVVLVIVLG